MADYIRRDIVLDIINTMNDTGGFAGYADYCTLFDEIDTMPASDVKPVKRGRWIETDKSMGVETAYACSECGYLVRESDRTNYCGDCGARMIKDGDKE